MIINKPVYEMTGEITPDIKNQHVWQYISDKSAAQETFNIFLVEDWQESHVVLRNIYVMGDYAIKDDVVIQEETAILCFQTHKLYLKQDNGYPIEESWDKKMDIYSRKTLMNVGFEEVEGMPTHFATPYADA